MGFFAIVGHYLLGFGPAVALLLGFVSLRAQLLIITIIRSERKWRRVELV